MKTVRLGDICDIVSGGTPSRSKPEFWQDGTIPWIKIGNIRGKYVSKADEYITKAGLDASSAKMLPKGTILYTIFATLGEVCILDIEACTNQAIAGISMRESSGTKSDYLYYYLKSKKSYVNGIGRGVAQNNINMSMLRDFRIPLPTIEQQDKIVSVLDRISSIIALRRQQLTALDELVKARFVEMFGDGKYDLKSVEELCSEIVDCPHTTPKYDGELKNPAIRTSEIKKGYIAWESMKFVSDDEYEERIARLRPEAGDIVYGREGTFGNAAILPAGYKFCLGQRVMLLRPNYKKTSSEYLLHAVISDDVYKQALDKNNASTVAHVNVKDVKQFKVPLPPLDLQKRFADFVSQVDKTKANIQKSLEKSQLLFDSLMQEYFG
ncbi:restriction endonuclease subunit S [bacterium]|nr:restriction endonuclease subunit S [bacterium]